MLVSHHIRAQCDVFKLLLLSEQHQDSSLLIINDRTAANHHI